MKDDEHWKRINRLSEDFIKHINSERHSINPGEAILALAITLGEIVCASSAKWEVVDRAIDMVKRKSAEKLKSLT